ncbi:MAG: hypothetical protein ACFE8A_00105 [Candidatus Hodarchaeota archaeon]
MAEMSKEIKIVFIINAIVAFIYGCIFLLIPDLYESLTDSPYHNPALLRLWGGTIILLGIVALLAVMRGEWDNVKIFFEFAILWLIMVEILGLLTFTYVPYTAASLASQIMDMIVVAILLVMDIYFYLREEKS